MKQKIIISALGTNSGTFLANYAKEKYFVVGTDIYPSIYVPASKEVDLFLQVPTVLDEKEYFSKLVSICEEYKVDFILPIIDEEVEMLARNYQLLKDLGVTPLVPDYETVKICRDKELTFSFVEKNLPEINTRTLSLDRYEDNFEYPVFVKPKAGRASIGCSKINGCDELEMLKNNIDIKDYIIQEFHQGKFIALDFIHNPVNGDFACIAREEIIRNKNGCGTVVKIIKDEFLERAAHKLAIKLNYKGIGNLEFIVDEKGCHLLEINPRFPAGTEYSISAGADLFNDEVKICQHIETKMDYKIKYNNVYARRYETYDMGLDNER